SLAQGRRIGDQIRQAEQLIEADVRNSLQAVRSAEARLASAAASRSSAEQQYASEQRQLRAGTTTVFLVLQRQTELLAARARELQAQTDLNKAVSALNRATGSTLQANNVAVRTDSALPELEQTKPADDSTLDAEATAVTSGASSSGAKVRP
ncbi:MAG TPA: TolC family protein, partial [Pyrinomonadaceae bacterium]|nr:TolC family protein [Pyrinomonadaceae bacterium]